MKFTKPFAHFNSYSKGFTLIEVLIVIAILGVLASVVIPNFIQLRGEGEEEAKKMEHNNVQLVTRLMLIYAEVDELDNSYNEVQTFEQIKAVTAASGLYSLDNYLYMLSDAHQFTQAYDIAEDGTVTVD